jgi:phospholipid-binding lipoprotein MlaA
MKILHVFFVSIILGTMPISGVAAEPAETPVAIPDLLGEDDFDQEYLDEPKEPVLDPLEPVNRLVFQFNDRLYVYMLKPLADGYSWVVPREIRESLGNFFVHLGFPLTFINSALQGDVDTMTIAVERFLINSTLGVYGFADVAATEFDIRHRRADFGQTLGRWGVGEGVYITWPLLGPSSVRDSFGLAVDTVANPLPYAYDSRTVDIALFSTERVNYLSLHPGLYDDLQRYSLDPYVASRQAYFDYRRGLLKRD